MVSKGKSRRRREAILQQAKNDQRLPPPPKASKENQLLPAGLRKMMALKDSLKGSVQTASRYVKRGPDGGLPGLSKPSEERRKEVPAKKAAVNKGSIAGNKRGRDQTPSVLDTSSGKPEEEQVLTGLAKRRNAHSHQQALRLFLRKRADGSEQLCPDELFLKDKKGKKRKKKSNEEDEAYRALYKQDKVAFGDVVQAPPKLSSKPKGKGGHLAKEKDAAGRRHWPERLGALAASQERLRQQAVEGYRLSKGRVEGPRLLPPVLKDLESDHQL